MSTNSSNVAAPTDDSVMVELAPTQAIDMSALLAG